MASKAIDPTTTKDIIFCFVIREAKLGHY